MNRKERFKTLKAKEAQIVANIAEHNYNVELTNEDFKDNHLVASAYLKIIDSIISSNLEQRLVIEVPQANSANFKSDLEHSVALELKSLQKKKKEDSKSPISIFTYCRNYLVYCDSVFTEP